MRPSFGFAALDGAFRWHIARAVPIRDASGKIDCWIGTNTDIEDQKAAESRLAVLAETLEQRVEERTAELNKTQDALRQSQKMEAIGNLTGGVAHDFNNLLQVISGNLQLLAKDVAGNDRAERRVSNALAGVSRGGKLASQLLAFGRRAALEPKVVNIGRFVSGMDDILRRAIGEGIEIETMISGGLWNTFIDPAQIENALLNLAINARDAMDGNGKLTIEAGNAFLDDAYVRDHGIEAGQYVMLAVTDTGAGHVAGCHGTRLRTVFFDEAGRKRNRPRTVDGLRVRQAIRRACEDLQRGRHRHDNQALPAASGPTRGRAGVSRIRRRSPEEPRQSLWRKTTRRSGPPSSRRCGISDTAC